MSDSEGYDLGDHSWTEVSGGRGRRRGRGGGERQKQQERLRGIPGALGLLSGAKDRRNQQHQQQSNLQDKYPKIVSKRAGFRQVNTCSLLFKNVKVGPNKTMPSDLEINLFLIKKCNLKLQDFVKCCVMRNR